ncbi:MAG TPA: Na+/H+ antiporter [Candidatus Limnocylindrales bacterium]|nr:Na+/H+ antiporter [Candidatus Limnocylindrales bacterium]
MIELSPIELVLGLLVVAIALAYVARRIGVAYPILLVLGGLALGFLPGLPSIELEPDVVFLLLLPPILFGAGYSTPIRDFKANARPIGLLAIGLVLFTTAAVGLVANVLIPELGIAAALALGAIVAPPDAVAATAIFQRLHAPRRIVTIIEGESLINDASALIAYRFAVAAALGTLFSPIDAGLAFVYVGVGGVVVGLVVGAVVTEAWRRTSDPTLEIMVSLLAPFAAYLPAETLGVSGVLATVVAGLIAGRRAARVLSPSARLMGRGVWDIVIFLINSFAFMLVGLQLSSITSLLAPRSASELLGLGAAISLTAIVARIVWVFPATYLPRRLSARLRARDPDPPARAVFVISWAGMRGAVSLAAALALPRAVPERELLIFLTFCVIAATLVGQGLSLPWLMRRLHVVAGSGAEMEEATARLAAVEAAMARLNGLAEEFPGHLELVDQLRARYDHEISHVAAPEGPRDESELELLEHLEIRNAVLAAEREAIIGLRDAGVIGDEVLRRIERDLDLEALRTGA